MADGVGVKTGSDAVIATDDAGAGGQVQIIKLAISADGSATLIGADANGLDVDPTRLPGTVADGGALPPVIFVVGGFDGSAAQALATDASGVVQADVLALPALPAGSNAIGKVIVSALEGEPKVKVVEVPALVAGANKIGDVGLSTRTSGGASIFSSINVGAKAEIKGSAGQIYGYSWSNKATTPRFLKFFNVALAGVTLGTTAATMTIELPKESAGHVSWPVPIAFGTAITVAAVKGVATANSEVPGENDVILNCFFA